mgnify:CR=1 FL=1
MAQSILDIIGNTPLVEIRKLNPNPQVRILAKMECFNPGGSIKDRPALYMILEAEKRGDIAPGATLVEGVRSFAGNVARTLFLLFVFIYSLFYMIRDGDKALMESLLAFKRAGCDGILTYFSPQVARILHC